jgi:two-component system, OmpR family, response regulator
MKKHILVVDDDISIRTSLQKILTDAGYQVTAVGDGDSAESTFENADLLILDLNLPIQDGWDILGHVNADYPMLPVIVITGLADQLDERAIPGAAAFLEKPIDVVPLLSAIECLLTIPAEQRSGGLREGSDLWRDLSSQGSGANWGRHAAIRKSKNSK